MTSTTSLAAALAATIMTAALSSPIARAEQAAPTPIRIDATGFNTVLATAGDRLFISGQPSPEGFERLRAAGVNTVINLRTEPEMDALPFNETELLGSLNMTYIHLPSGGPDTPYTPATLERFAAVLSAAEGKVLLHCTVAWRASHLYAAYLHRYQGLTLKDAIDHATIINFGGLPIEGFLGETLEVKAQR